MKGGNNFIDKVGLKINMLTVISRNRDRNDTKVYWNCICECGNTTVVQTNKLSSGHTKSCGCLIRRHNRTDLVGLKFGMLTVISFHDKTDSGRVRWNCLCNCGNSTIVRAHNLCSGEVKSCGCLPKMAHFVKHGLTNHRLFHIFDNMKARCYRKTSKGFKYYGARGVTIYGPWLLDFKLFYDWALQNGYKEDLTIERNDFNGNYHPDNCCWITKSQQGKNKRNILGQKIADEIRVKLKSGATVPELALFYNIHKCTVRNIKTGRTYFDIKME